jgi:dipeptidyl aminopeptidase/acylaminoacyl peptidase
LVSCGLPYQDAAFQAVDGLTLRGWFVPAQSSDEPAIVHAHGSGHDQRVGLSILPALHKAGYGVLLFSYRGCGHSDAHGRGMTYGYGESEDLDSAVSFLRQMPHRPSVGVIGYSIGAASALLSAARNQDINAVVAVAPFARPREVWAANRPRFLPTPLLAWMRSVVKWRKGISLAAMDLTTAVPQIAPRPILLIHGSRDERIPFAQVQQLHEAAGEPTVLWVLEGETHQSVRTRGLERRMVEVIAFFDQALRTP